MLNHRLMPILATASLVGLGACAAQYGSAVGKFGKIQVVSANAITEVWIVRYVDLLKAYPQLPNVIPVNDSGLANLLRYAPSGRPNQGEYLFRDGRYFLSYRCGEVQRFTTMDVQSTGSTKTFQVACP